MTHRTRYDERQHGAMKGPPVRFVQRVGGWCKPMEVRRASTSEPPDDEPGGSAR